MIIITKDAINSMGRKQIIKNFVILALVVYFFKLSIVNAAILCVIAGVLEYCVSLFYKHKANDSEMVDAIGGMEALSLLIIKTLLSSIAWFSLAAILFIIDYFDLISVLHNMFMGMK